MAHTGVQPNRHTYRDTGLETNVRGVHGYHAYCACGWEGEVRKTWGEAQCDAGVHRLERHSRAG